MVVYFNVLKNLKISFEFFKNLNVFFKPYFLILKCYFKNKILIVSVQNYKFKSNYYETHF